ncbi:flagellar biosynthesis repressor FlbT [Afifella pfennigii]|uniref:flagellar biosynthesis repressor FlbT n=1 Tax=Afifella pfennigii TaxID=209897 RepID=UPI00068D5233|nr:flagellar biosynthesis repressor FlbT [Afifella pfennigii]
MHISLRPGQRIFVNGAVLRVDRKVTLELLNDATFLLDNHVIQANETTTPLRQLYFVVQTMLIDPGSADSARDLFRQMHGPLCKAFNSRQIQAGLAEVADLVERGRSFEALRNIRALFPAETAVLSGGAEAEAEAA